ncbi:UNVERIFIED_CONTAM: hypothetical protein Q9R58_28600 [Methylobacteriaceae bacterium AG10]|nr:hypothetical protein [Methylobacteriaceae bacterium AG10]
MADITNSGWSEADSSNTQPAPNGLPPGILPSEVGGVVRAVMGGVKRFHSRSNVMVTSTGSANAYAIAYAVGPDLYVKGEVFNFFANFTNTGASTLNINALGNRALLRADGSAVAAGEIVAGQVISVVFDGASFLAQNVVSKEFKANVSIVKENDAILTIEDTGAPANTFRRKMILSSRNVSGGNDWLFRQVRASDGASEDFTLRSGTAGTIWTTGNFNPALKADLAGSTFTGSVYVPGIGTNGFEAGTGDGANYTTYNTKLRSHYGLALTTYDGTVNGIWDSRAGVLDVKGALRVNGQTAWHTGNFNPATKADLNTTPRFTGVLLGTGNGNIYADAGAHNVVLRSGSGAADQPFKYAAMQPDLFRTYSADIYADGNLRTTGRVIVGEGQTNTWIEMRDTDEGTRYLHNNSGNIGFVGSGGDWVFQVRDNGTVWTKQFGDLGARIDTIAAAQGNRGRDEANANTAAYYAAKTTPTVNGSVFVNGGTSYGSVQPAISLFNGGIEHWNIMAVNDGQLYFRNGDNGDVRMRLNRDGSLYLKQIGDLNTRIEDRASAWSASRRDEANTNTANNYFNKTTGTAQGVNNIPSFNASAIDIVRGGVLRARWTVDGSGNTILQNGDNGDNYFFVNTGGGVWTKEFGWLNTRIEDRAYAHASGQAGARVAKTGDTMTGDLTISKSYPNINFLYGGVRQWQAQVRENGQFYFFDQTANQFNVSFDLEGGIWTRKWGDLGQRIEDRAYAWAATRQANLGFTPVEQGGGPYQGTNKVRLGWDGSALRVSVDGGDHERVLHRSWVNPVIDIRLAYAGDLDNGWNINASYAEPYQGGVLTSRFTTNNQFTVSSWQGGRWRYLQKQDSYGNWYTVGYV